LFVDGELAGSGNRSHFRKTRWTIRVRELAPGKFLAGLLNDDRIIALFTMEPMGGRGQKSRPPSGTDGLIIFKEGSWQLVFMGVYGRFPAQ
jgi:hypothetical protein